MSEKSCGEDRQLTHAYHRANKLVMPISLLLHDFQVPMNVGSIFRVCDALGVAKLFLSGSTPVPPNNRLTKTSRATEKFVAYEYIADARMLLQQLRHEGYTILALEITHTSIDLKQVDFSRHERIVLLVGAERHGINSDLLALADYSIHIPMLGQNSSMNVATACAIAVYEITRQWSCHTPKAK